MINFKELVGISMSGSRLIGIPVQRSSFRAFLGDLYFKYASDPKVNVPIYCWDIAVGLRKFAPEEDEDGKPKYDENGDRQLVFTETDFNSTSPVDAIRYIEVQAKQGQEAVYVLQNTYPYIDPDSDLNNIQVQQALTNLAYELQTCRTIVIIADDDFCVPPSFEGLIHYLPSPLPDFEGVKQHAISNLETIRNIFEVNATAYREGGDINKAQELEQKAAQVQSIIDGDGLDKLTRSMQGMTHEQSTAALYKAAFTAPIKQLTEKIAESKRDALRSRNISILPPITDEVAGLDIFKKHSSQWKATFSAEAQQYNIDPAKGALLLGIPGCGKSMIAKKMGHEWGLPVLSLDMSHIFDSLVGSSERNMRLMLEAAEANAPCILFADELDKALAGVGGQGGDGGTSQRVFGKFLSWLADKTSQVFVIATANDISFLPPELTRAGRFDKIFFVGLPNTEARKQIIKSNLDKYGHELSDQQIDSIAADIEGYSGAEIATLIKQAATSCLCEGRPGKITVSDIKAQTCYVTPHSKAEGMASKYAELEDKAKKVGAIEATSPESQPKRRTKSRVALS
jgi:AAA+ superfamily predicted ATPase